MNKYYTIHTVYFLMITLTALSYLIGETTSGGIGAMLFLLLAVMIKGGLIIRDFMELNGVSLLWRVIMYGWLWIVCAGISVPYFMSV